MSKDECVVAVGMTNTQFRDFRKNISSLLVKKFVEYK